MPTRARLLACVLAFGACTPNVLEVVRPAGSDGACAAEMGGGMNCPTGAQYAFDADTQGFTFGAVTGNASALRTSCRFTFCGGGALAYHAEWTYAPADGTGDTNRLTSLERPLEPPVDLTGRILYGHVLVDAQSTPMNAQIAVRTENRYRLVKINILEKGWNYLSEDLSRVDPPIPSLGAVTTVIVEVYLATPATWSGEVYIDEVGWR